MQVKNLRMSFVGVFVSVSVYASCINGQSSLMHNAIKNKLFICAFFNVHERMGTFKLHKVLH